MLNETNLILLTCYYLRDEEVNNFETFVQTIPLEKKLLLLDDSSKTMLALVFFQRGINLD